MELRLVIEKGPREGETLAYSSDSVIKIGRVIKGNTIAIKESGISSKHMCIQFDRELKKWIICDLNSSNGTFLNTKKLQPHVPSLLNDGDRVKIGELTSVVVKIEAEVELPVRPRRNPRQQAKSGAGSAAAVGEIEKNESGLGFDGDLGKIEVKEPVKKRNLRSNVKKDVELKNEVESLGSRRTLRSSKKDEVSFVSELNQIPENLKVDVTETVDVSVPVEPKKTRGRRRKMPEQVPDLDQTNPANVVVVPVRTTRGRRKALPVEPLEDKLENVTESLQADEGNEATLGENLDSNNEPVQEQLEKLVSTQDGCEGFSKGEEEYMKYGCYNDKWNDLEKMTVGDFFDYLEWQLGKEIYEKSEKIIADMTEKARKYHEFRRQINESGKGKLVTD